MRNPSMNLGNLTLVGPGAVNWVFKPGFSVGGEATFIKSNGVPLADKTLKIKTTRTPTGRVKVTYNLSIPVVQDMEVAGVTRPTVVRTAYFTGTFSADQTSSTTERMEILELIDYLIGSDESIAVFRDLEYLV
jgi:hypothetical protein